MKYETLPIAAKLQEEINSLKNHISVFESLVSGTAKLRTDMSSIMLRYASQNRNGEINMRNEFTKDSLIFISIYKTLLEKKLSTLEAEFEEL